MTHLSSFAQYFFPLGNFIAPIIIWSAKKNDSEFVDFNGKQILNFQLSIFAYSLILIAISLPLMIYGFAAEKVSAWLKSNPKTLNTISACVLLIIGLYVAILQTY